VSIGPFRPPVKIFSPDLPQESTVFVGAARGVPEGHGYSSTGTVQVSQIGLRQWSWFHTKFSYY
jgi:hypothetical protein